MKIKNKECPAPRMGRPNRAGGGVAQIGEPEFGDGRRRRTREKYSFPPQMWLIGSNTPQKRGGARPKLGTQGGGHDGRQRPEVERPQIRNFWYALSRQHNVKGKTI